MIDLFSNGDTTASFSAHSDKMIAKIKGLPDEKILNTSIDEWVEYFVGEYTIHPIILFMDNIVQSFSETVIREHNPLYSGNRYDYEYFQIEGYKITFTIPFDGDSNLLNLRPSSFYLSTFPVEDIIRSSDDRYGVIVFCLEFKKKELQDKNDQKEFVASRFTQEFKPYIETINRIRNEVAGFNISLPKIARAALDARKRKANDYFLMGEKLNIPLSLNPNAPNTTPIILKKEPIRKPEMPKQRMPEKQYQIQTSDYDNIRRVISLAGVSMEKSARTFSKLGEEELRDVIIANLNTHYEGTASAETFSRVGKTDIHIQFDNKAAYIGECKIWHGESLLQDAIEQLFSYTTWRDVKTSLIIFNKDNKDFPKLLKTIANYLSNNPLCKNIHSLQENEWICEFQKNEGDSTVITVHLIVFDLFI